VTELPPGWTITETDRVVGHEDQDSAFTDGRQVTLRGPDGQRPPQAEWPTSWRPHAIAYAWSVHARRLAGLLDEEPPPYAHGPGAMDMLPRQPHPPVHERFHRKWQTAGEPVHPVQLPYAAPAPDVVLVRRPIATLAELVALSNGAKLALGVTAKTPNGQLGPGWTWWARHGFGQRGSDGRISESVFLRVDRPPRSALFLWSRPVPDPRLIHALSWQHMGANPDAGDPIEWPLMAAVLAQLPAPDWTSEYVTAWTTTDTGRPEDIPRPTPSAAVKKEIRS
jgi:hypothetical protein